MRQNMEIRWLHETLEGSHSGPRDSMRFGTRGTTEAPLPCLSALLAQGPLLPPGPQWTRGFPGLWAVPGPSCLSPRDGGA